MASTEAIQAVQAIYDHVDTHVRELLPPPAAAEVDSALMLLMGGASETFGGTGATVAPIATGIAGCWSFDFKCRITGWYIQEFDGTTGSVVLALQKAPRGATPTFTSIVASAPPTVTSGRYGEDSALLGWDTYLDRGDLVRVSVTSVSAFTRLLVGLRIRRLEP
jgi:hypothetical protein